MQAEVYSPGNAAEIPEKQFRLLGQFQHVSCSAQPTVSPIPEKVEKRKGQINTEKLT